MQAVTSIIIIRRRKLCIDKCIVYQAFLEKEINAFLILENTLLYKLDKTEYKLRELIIYNQKRQNF